MSNLGSDGEQRADARRNARRLLRAAAELIATDPAVGLERIAARAGVSRATLYHHFGGRDALLDALTDESIEAVAAAVGGAAPAEGPAEEAMRRVLLAAWEVIGRYRGLVVINPQRLPAAELRTRLAPALAPIRALIARGQADGAFDPELPPEWLIGVIVDLIHGASRQVTAGTMSAAQAERALVRSATAALTSHQR